MNLRENNLHIFDIDDTLFHTNAKVKVVDHQGKVVQRLSNSEFNDHNLQPNHSYNFSEFRSADKFHDESKPITKMLNKLKAIHGNIKKKAGSKSRVIMNTARADFDDKNKFLDTFRKQNVDIDNIHVHRAGNIQGNELPAVKKVKIIKRHLESGDYKHAHMYDDSTTNLDHFLAMKNDHPHVQFHAYHVQHDGSMKRYHGNKEIHEDAPANAAGSGNVAGLGVGSQGEPPGPQSILTRLLKRKPLEQEDTQRIPRKPNQPAKSDKHSDLYTDEDPKGTIHGLKFATPDDAKMSVKKIKTSGRSHAHKIQAAIAMEQRARVMGKTGAAAIYRSFINSMKKKTEDMREENEVKQEEKWSDKYKKSIDCSNPKGFSQKAHCDGRKARQSGRDTKSDPIKEWFIIESMFAGNKVFVVPSDYYYNCKMGKNRYHKYEKYVGKDEIGETIRRYGRDRKNRKKPIIVQDERTGAMTYLRYGGKPSGKPRKDHT